MHAISIWERMEGLEHGWDGYDAEPPSPLARGNALEFVMAARRMGLETARIAPSVVGGVGVTYYDPNLSPRRRAYVEFFNDGGAAVLFSDGVSEPESRAVGEDEGARALIRSIRDYLTGTA